jgi:nickel superoxide dismutase
MYIGLSIFLILSGVFAMQSYTHCQIPCGIYDDDVRFKLLEEHLTTIEKSMVQLGASMESDPPNGNQVVRWVMNKEQHADDFTHIVTYYFLAQRIKPTEGAGKDAYLAKLEMLHNLIVLSMKCKQTDDVANVTAMRETLGKFKEAYFKG